MIAYFAEALEHENLGKVKLFKLMFLADFKAKARLGEPITGETYLHYRLGPVPSTLMRDFNEIMSACAVVRREKLGRHPIQQIYPNSDFRSSVDFSDEQREILEGVVERYGQLTGSDLTRITHRMIPYQVTDQYEEIPYGLAGYVDDYKKPTKVQAHNLLRNSESLKSALTKALNAN